MHVMRLATDRRRGHRLALRGAHKLNAKSGKRTDGGVSPMKPHEYEDLLVGVWEQLPLDVERTVTIAIQCDDICDQLRVAIFTARDGTQAPERLQRRQRAA